MPTSRLTRARFLLLSTAVALFPAVAAGQQPPKRDRNLISREELVQAAEKFSDLYQAIRSLRPHFLTVNNRGVRTSGTGGTRNMNPVAVVYLDGIKSGQPEFLMGLLTRNAAEVRYLSPNDAGMEYGLGHEGGAIVVKLFMDPKPPG